MFFRLCKNFLHDMYRLLRMWIPLGILIESKSRSSIVVITTLKQHWYTMETSNSITKMKFWVIVIWYCLKIALYMWDTFWVFGWSCAVETSDIWYITKSNISLLMIWMEYLEFSIILDFQFFSCSMWRKNIIMYRLIVGSQILLVSKKKKI